MSIIVDLIWRIITSVNSVKSTLPILEPLGLTKLYL